MKAWMSLNFGQISSLTLELTDFFTQIFLILADNQNWENSELPAFEHHKLWCLQTLAWLPGERSFYLKALNNILANLKLFL